MKLSGHTIFVAVPESTLLTRQMGSNGADGYLATATFTLTELEGITHVNFDFEEGDHSRPGIYNRQFYLDRNKR